jgi:ATP-binding cassette subfamily F protein 3
MEDLCFAYNDDKRAVVGSNDKMVLNGITAHIGRGSKIALVGVNGCGKSTLMKLIAGQLHDHDDSVGKQTGTLWVHPNIRIGHITQYSVEELDQFGDETVMEYAEKRLMSGVASVSIVTKKASGNVRHYLGAFGLGGKHALQKIGQLSGGERMRLCFATCLVEEPHLLLLDESTNHVDLETLESMSVALNKYEGSVLMVSHNQAFLRGFCQELWVLEDGRITVKHSETATFDEMFAKYRQDILGGKGGGTSTLLDQRQQKAVLAKKASAQRAGAKEATSLL